MKKSRVFMSATALVASCILGAGLTGFAAADDPPEDLSVVDDDLEGLTLVAGGEVYNADLEPVASIDEYVEQYADAGIDIPEAQAEATEVEGGFAPLQTLGASELLGSKGSSLRGGLKMEATGCVGQDKNRSLQRFNRAAKGGAPRGIADLRCGVAGPAGWGWRHITSGHAGDYGRISSLMGKSWDSYAKWCLGQTLGVPSSAAYQASNNTYVYYTLIQIWSNGRLYKTYTNHVSVSKGDFRIITEYFS
ncbi:hypothetical protein [Leifsonia sp. NPDC077715]|uniref:hypothetical protein n=1 Tax=Leifsonia sp. NPDC077715 TaxID=3155539 RepID=UPI0034367058